MMMLERVLIGVVIVLTLAVMGLAAFVVEPTHGNPAPIQLD